MQGDMCFLWFSGCPRVWRAYFCTRYPSHLASRHYFYSVTLNIFYGASYRNHVSHGLIAFPHP